mgnify:CR=1 FL=1
MIVALFGQLPDGKLQISVEALRQVEYLFLFRLDGRIAVG